jgi:hypothetical protein
MNEEHKEFIDTPFNQACKFVKYVALLSILINEIFGFGLSNWINITFFFLFNQLSSTPIQIILENPFGKDDDDDDDDFGSGRGAATLSPKLGK